MSCRSNIPFLPFLLGSNGNSRLLAAEIFRQYGTVSVILDGKCTLADRLSLSYKFVRLSSVKYPEIISQQLITLAHENQTSLPVLLPCTKEFKAVTERCAQLLEPHFVLVSGDDPKNIFNLLHLLLTDGNDGTKGGDSIE